MRRISERLGLEREFARRDDRLDFAAPRPVEITAPEAIYTSPGGAVSEEFLPEKPQVVRIPKSIFVRYPPLSPPIKEISPRTVFIETKAQVSTPARNFIDIFFDWLNKILSGT
ncbi:hypothetical protein ES702_04395 [subsurface metagenome]